MNTAIYNIKITQGADYEEFFNLKDDTGEPLSLVGFTAHMQIRPFRASDKVLVDATSENGIIFINGVLGRIEINLSKEQTISLIYSKSTYDLFLTNSSGFTIKVLKGDVDIDLRVTRV